MLSNTFVTNIDAEGYIPSYTIKSKKRLDKSHNWDEFGEEADEEAVC
jgi:hypothetical protein